jgi:hypothetical protein
MHRHFRHFCQVGKLDPDVDVAASLDEHIDMLLYITHLDRSLCETYADCTILQRADFYEYVYPNRGISKLIDFLLELCPSFDTFESYMYGVSLVVLFKAQVYRVMMRRVREVRRLREMSGEDLYNNIIVQQEIFRRHEVCIALLNKILARTDMSDKVRFLIDRNPEILSLDEEEVKDKEDKLDKEDTTH